jgi:hypothetical protein
MVSFTGLDLSFLKSKESQEALRAWRHKAEEKRAARSVSVLRRKRSHLAAPMVMGDIRPFVSPVGASPEVISSRSTLRAHERKHGVYQCGDIPQGAIVQKNEEKRAKLIEQAQGVTYEWA